LKDDAGVDPAEKRDVVLGAGGAWAGKALKAALGI
jgi:hypothetical protein